jgi:hypothetical protein
MTSCFRELTLVDGGKCDDRSLPSVRQSASEFNSNPVPTPGSLTPLHTTFAAAGENFAALFGQVEENREVVVIHRPGHGDVAMVRMDDLVRLLESARRR